jgi:GNAT superfamily N-acetyltransferase
LVGEPEIRLAQTDEVDAAHNLMLSTARWLEEKGAALWLSEELNAEDTRQCAARNELVLAVEGTSVVGIMRREWEDPVFWPEAKRGEAAYLHRLAVARTHAGTGLSQALVRWAIADARRRELAFLRHDCEPRPALIRFYSSLGFSRIDTFATGKFTVVRWQMDISLNQDKK